MGLWKFIGRGLGRRFAFALKPFPMSLNNSTFACVIYFMILPFPRLFTISMLFQRAHHAYRRNNAVASARSSGNQASSSASASGANAFASSISSSSSSTGQSQASATAITTDSSSQFNTQTSNDPPEIPNPPDANVMSTASIHRASTAQIVSNPSTRIPTPSLPDSAPRRILSGNNSSNTSTITLDPVNEAIDNKGKVTDTPRAQGNIPKPDSLSEPDIKTTNIYVGSFLAVVTGLLLMTVGALIYCKRRARFLSRNDIKYGASHRNISCSYFEKASLF